MKLTVIYNSDKTNAEKIAKNVVNKLNEFSVNTNILEFSSKDNWNLSVELIKNDDVVIAVGGDGTIIKISKYCAEFGIPLLGVNAGRLGYLASINADNLDILERVVNGDYTVEERIMLHAEKYQNGVLTDCCDALNEVLISLCSSPSIINFNLKIGSDCINYRADGLIAATPTGSTAYSMSAGGPIVDPVLSCIILTAICPHSLVNRSMIVNGSKPVAFSFEGNNENVYLSADGKREFSVNENCTVNISVSEKKAKFIKLGNASVYKVFSENHGNI